jgi:hypothetical protein
MIIGSMGSYEGRQSESVLHIWVLEDQLDLLYDLLAQLLQDDLVLSARVVADLLQELSKDPLGFQQRFVQIGLLDAESQGIDFF